MRKEATDDQYEWFVKSIVRVAVGSEKDARSSNKMMDSLDDEARKLAPAGGSVFFLRTEVAEHVQKAYGPAWTIVKHMFGRSDVYERQHDKKRPV